MAFALLEATRETCKRAEGYFSQFHLCEDEPQKADYCGDRLAIATQQAMLTADLMEKLLT